MKKVKFIYVILAGFMLLPFFNSCKKGDQDPFLSLRSRDKRLIKEWKLTKIEGAEINAQILPTSYTTTTNYSFDGTTYQRIVTTSSNSTPTTTTYTGSYSMEIKDDGSISVEEIITTSGSSPTTTTRTSKGEWVWLTGNKKKDHLALSLYNSFTLFNGEIVYVNRLANDEMVLKTSSAESDATGSSSSSSSSDFTYTFKMK